MLSASAESDDGVAERLRGFGPLGILAILVILAGNFLFLPCQRKIYSHPRRFGAQQEDE
jgi:hypothetical protein